ncbi:MAG: alpha amylase C-terminal domain-containing protein [Lentisphaeria bacterium]|nr:alpha amylase C-terminal domain-containing protein [Lentisphaeria bacterium]
MKLESRHNTPVALEQDPFLHPFLPELRARKSYADKLAAKLTCGKGENLADHAREYEFFGLHFCRNKWIFREYAPHALQVILTGDFCNWQIDDRYSLRAIGNGCWEGIFPEESFRHGMHYKMLVRFPGGEGLRIPAFADYVVQNEADKQFSAVVWHPEKPYKFRYPSPPAVPPVIYEAHVGMAQEAPQIGTYREFTRKILPEIARKGYNTVQLMGIMEHPYYGSFGYHVANFFAVSSRFGTPDEFKELVDTAHKLNLRVIIDLVHSHSVRNVAEGLAEIDGCRTTYFHAGERGEHPAWDSLCFNYADERVLRFLLSNCRYFLEKYNVDGYRFDGVTSMLYTHHGLNHCFTGYEEYFNCNVDQDAVAYLTLANRVIHAVNPDALTIAEDVSGMPGLASKAGIGFDYRLAMGVTDMWFKMLDIPDENWNMFQLYGELINRRRDEKSISYVECHDQAIVGGKSSFFRMTDAEIYYNMHRNSGNNVIDRAMALHKLFRLSTAAAAGHGYLNFMGNEFGHPEWIDLPREGNNWSMDHARRQWSLEKDPALRFGQLSAFDREITGLIGEKGFFDRPVQTVRIDEQGKVIAFERDSYWFFFNFHPVNSYSDYELEVQRGTYMTVLDSDDAGFGGFGRREKGQRYFSMERSFGEVISLYLPCRTALVLRREK